MGEATIPTALDPHGNYIPIEEAPRHKADYYRCPECGEIVNPRKGEKRIHYYAHKQGVLEDKTCELSSRPNIEEMVDELRVSDVEKREQQRNIQVFLGERSGGGLELFGTIPSLEWDAIPVGQNLDELLDQITLNTDGIETPPVASNFSPSEPEVLLPLESDAESFRVEVTGENVPEMIKGTWTAPGLSSGDLFVGDQGRARRHQENRQIKLGEWVYLAVDDVPDDCPDIVDVRSLDSETILAFPARETISSLLEEYGPGLTTDEHGFDADVLLPPTAHPTSEAPIETRPGEDVLIGVTPAAEIDPTFEVVAIPKYKTDPVELESTGPGNPRYFLTKAPDDGSRRISIHQQNSSRHRPVHLHSAEQYQSTTDTERRQIGLEVTNGDSTTVLSPLSDTSHVVWDANGSPATLQSDVEYVGPTGLEMELTFVLTADGNQTQTVTKQTTTPSETLAKQQYLLLQGCEEIQFEFDGIGTAAIEIAGAKK